jgi:hypothetical protein
VPGSGSLSGAGLEAGVRLVAVDGSPWSGAATPGGRGGGGGPAGGAVSRQPRWRGLLVVADRSAVADTVVAGIAVLGVATALARYAADVGLQALADGLVRAGLTRFGVTDSSPAVPTVGGPGSGEGDAAPAGRAPGPAVRC